MTLETLYKKYLKLMAQNKNPYNFLELLSSEGLIPRYSANEIKAPTIRKWNISLPTFSNMNASFFDLLEDTGAMIKIIKPMSLNKKAILKEMVKILAGAANDNAGKSVPSSGSRAA